MQIVFTILIGFITGLLARAVKPGNDSLGFIYTVILGVLGALFANLAGQVMGFYLPGEPVGFLASVLGSVALLYIVEFIKYKICKNRRSS